jgi:micrococcal nuclease
MQFNKSNLIQFGAVGLFAIFLIAGSGNNSSANLSQKLIENSNENEVVSSEQAVESNQQETVSIENNNNKTINNLYSVVKVVDGDTIVVSIDGKEETLRLIGIDTPETVDPRETVQCFGLEASNKAKELLTGKKVSLEDDSTQGDRDKYDRLLRYVFLEDGNNFNLYMIKEGYAYEYTYSTSYKYQKEFKDAQSYAQTNNKGLWSPDTCNGSKIQSVQEEDNTIIESEQGFGACGTKKYCKDMISCEEAKYFLNTCGVKSLDGDKDGTPCESICF